MTFNNLSRSSETISELLSKKVKIINKKRIETIEKIKENGINTNSDKISKKSNSENMYYKVVNKQNDESVMKTEHPKKESKELKKKLIKLIFCTDKSIKEELKKELKEELEIELKAQLNTKDKEKMINHLLHELSKINIDELDITTNCISQAMKLVDNPKILNDNFSIEELSNASLKIIAQENQMEMKLAINRIRFSITRTNIKLKSIWAPIIIQLNKNN